MNQQSGQQLAIKNRSGLGRGLSALIADADIDSGNQNQTKNQLSSLSQQSAPLSQTGSQTSLSINQLQKSRYQPRIYISEAELQELADSIKKNGIVQPIVVRKPSMAASSETKYDIIAGERRWRAAKIAGLSSVPVTLMEVTDSQAMEIALVENIQRQNLKPLEIAKGYQRLMKEFSYTQEGLAEVIGKSRVQIANFLRLLNLPEAIKMLLDKNQLSVGHAKAILSIENSATQLEVAENIVKKKLNVRQTELFIKNLSRKKTGSTGTAAEKSEYIKIQEKNVSIKLGMQTLITPDKKGGKIFMKYKNADELDSFLKKINVI